LPKEQTLLSGTNLSQTLSQAVDCFSRRIPLYSFEMVGGMDGEMQEELLGEM
jgi:hypothetical protein